MPDITAMTAHEYLKQLRPRRLVYRALGVGRDRAHQFLRDDPAPIPAWLLKRLHRVLAPAIGVEAATSMVSETVLRQGEDADGSLRRIEPEIDAGLSEEIRAALEVLGLAPQHNTTSEAA